VKAIVATRRQGIRGPEDSAPAANRDDQQVVADILRETEEMDRREDELYGDARGDAPPEQLRTREVAAFKAAKERRRGERDRVPPTSPHAQAIAEGLVPGARLAPRTGG